MRRDKQLFAELAREASTDATELNQTIAANLLAMLFKQQRDLVTDPSYYKAAVCPRRAGKSLCVLVYALHTALTKPGAKILILARVMRQARAVYWGDIRKLCREKGIKATFRSQPLNVEFPNGSFLQFGGADTSEEIDKYRGQGFDLVCVDECKSYSMQLLQELLIDIIEPSLLDRLGTLCLIGTPGSVLGGPFYAVTTGDVQAIPPRQRPYWHSVEFGKEKARKWSRHSWTAKDNVACPWIWERSLKNHLDSGLPDDDPTWVRESLGRWVPNQDAMVYAYSKTKMGRCDWVKGEGKFGLPKGHTWKFLLGMDLGWHDATAFVVGAWADTHPALHFIHVERHPNLTVEEIAKNCLDLEVSYGRFETIVVDTGGLGKTILESLASTYGVSCVPARKQDKHDFIKLMNSDILTGRILLDPFSELADEWRNVQWADASRTKIDPGCDDHASDAALYLWRHAYHHLWNERQEGPQEGTADWHRQQQAESKERYRQQLLSQRNEDQNLRGGTVDQTRLPWNYRNYKD